MRGQKELLSTLDDTIKLKVKFGNNAKVPITGKGNINIIIKDGSKRCIAYVYYVPNLHKNLLGMGHLSNQG